MYTNVNLPVPIGALAFLGTAFLLVTLSGALLLLLIIGKRFAARLIALAVVFLVGLYFSGMLVFSLASTRNVVPLGQEKYFCEIDCHLAYSVLDASKTKHLGIGANQRTASREYTVVVVMTRFDESTISPHRGDRPLTPNKRVVSIIDEQGHEYFPLANPADDSTPMTTPLRPAELYLTQFVFDLPTNVKNPVLSIRESNSLTRLIIGHENSLFHKKTFLEL